MQQTEPSTNNIITPSPNSGAGRVTLEKTPNKKIYNFITSHDNYGDLLYPIMHSSLLGKKIFACAPFGPHRAPMRAGYHAEAVADVTKKETENKTVIIGGGAILRCNSDSTALNYKKILVRNSAIDFDPNEQEKYISHFNEKYFNYNSIGPWILKEKYFNKIIYSSCGSGASLGVSNKAETVEAFKMADYIYVRDFVTKRTLTKLGVADESINVAPDVVVSISDFIPKKDLEPIAKEVFERFGVDTSKEIITVQSFPQKNSETKFLLHKLNKLKKSGYEVVLLPIGYCHNDHKYLQKVNALAENAFKYVEVKNVMEITSVIQASNYFVGTSMHGCIVAFSYGVPFLVLPTGREKMQSFLEVCDLVPNLEIKSYEDIIHNMKLAKEMSKLFPEKLSAAKEKIYKVMSEIKAII